MKLLKKIKEWFIGDGGLVHPLCATCNGMDCHKYPECDHILLNKFEHDLEEEEKKNG